VVHEIHVSPESEQRRDSFLIFGGNCIVKRGPSSGVSMVDVQSQSRRLAAEGEEATEAFIRGRPFPDSY